MTKASMRSLLGCAVFLMMLALPTGCSDAEAEPAAATQTNNGIASTPITEKESTAPEVAADPPIQAELLHQQLEPPPVNAMLEQKAISVAYKGQSRFGALLLQSEGDAVSQTYSIGKIYNGRFEIIYSDREGNSDTIAQLESIHLQEHVQPWQWQTLELKDTDLFILQYDQSEYYKHQLPLRNIRLFAVSEAEGAIPLIFRIAAGGIDMQTEELTIQGDLPIEITDGRLVMYSALPEMKRLIFRIDTGEGAATLESMIDISDEYGKQHELAMEQAKILDQILFYGVGDNVNSFELDEQGWLKLMERVSDQAQQRESFKYMEKHRERFSRAFYWGVSDVRLDEELGRLSFTFAANVFYAIGQDLRLEVEMTKEGDEWKFADFGSLYMESFSPDREGAVIEVHES